jgi:hypothetical protein
LAKLTPVSWPELIKRLKELGLSGPYSGTKHPYMLKDSKVVLLPNPHHSGDISVDFLARLLRDAGISREDWLSV